MVDLPTSTFRERISNETSKSWWRRRDSNPQRPRNLGITRRLVAGLKCASLLDLLWLFRCFCKDPSNDLSRPDFIRAGFSLFPVSAPNLLSFPVTPTARFECLTFARQMRGHLARAGSKFTNGRSELRPIKTYTAGNQLDASRGGPLPVSGSPYAQGRPSCVENDSRSRARPVLTPRLRSVDVIEVELSGLGFGDAAAVHDRANEGARDRRAENPLAVTLLES